MMNFLNNYKGKAIKALALCCAFFASVSLSSCSSDNDPFFTAAEEDSPRILNTDIPEWSNGQPGTLLTIDRKTNFKFEVIATPRHYTTIEWYLDGEKIYEGATIDQPVLAGEHLLKIVAKTTMGKETSRTTILSVKPSEGDPILGKKGNELWVAPGATTTIHDCSNIDKVSKVYINGVEASDVSVGGNALTFKTPTDLAEGEYNVVVEDTDGQKYGCNKITISNVEYPVKETTIWEGEFAVTWGTPFKDLKDTFLPMVKVGTILRVYVDGNGQGTAATSWWTNLVTGKSDPERGDIPVNGPATWEFELSDLSIQLLTEQQGLFIVGDGYTVKKVTIE